MAGRLFGTDGVRGRAGSFLTPELALALGRAATERIDAERPRVVILRDTRESGEMFESALAAGVSAAGGEALLAGILPTPAAPLLIKRYGFDLAAVISASHNTFEDNGIKFFASDGFKLSDEDEAAIEAALGGAAGAGGALPGTGGPDAPSGAAREIGRIRRLWGAPEDYLRELHTRYQELDLGELDVLLDCANGATYEVAPEIFRRLGARVSVIGDTPDGRNINEGCGSTHIDELATRVLDEGRAVGFAFDGDGDRMLAVDSRGRVVDGDELMAIVALRRSRDGSLRGNGVAVTVMTNYGFHAAMERAGVAVATTAVGDRYVLEELRAREWALGGEQSGHMIDMDFNSTGDGIASALLVLEALAGSDLSERDAMEKLPQRLVNVEVSDRDAAVRSETLAQAVRHADEGLAGRGRVLVRPSGTEPLVRVMVEAPTEAEAAEVCERLVALVRSEVG